VSWAVGRQAGPQRRGDFSGSIPGQASWLRGTPCNRPDSGLLFFKDRLSEGRSVARQRGQHSRGPASDAGHPPSEASRGGTASAHVGKALFPCGTRPRHRPKVTASGSAQAPFKVSCWAPVPTGKGPRGNCLLPYSIWGQHSSKASEPSSPKICIPECVQNQPAFSPSCRLPAPHKPVASTWRGG